MNCSKIGACVAFVFIAAIPFQPWSKASRGSASFEATIRSTQSGIVRVSYDVGEGFNDNDSGESAVIAGQDSALRIPLPSGRLNALKFDLLGRDFKMTLGGSRISAGSGRVLCRFEPGQFRPLNQISQISGKDGDVEIASAPDAGAATVAVFLPKSFPLPSNHFWLWLLGAAVALFAGVNLCERAMGLGGPVSSAAASGLWSRAALTPGRAILAAAVLGTIIANYPVIFAGKSLVSPNMNTALLYGQSPYVPGFQSVERGNSNSADIDALMWDQVPFSIIERQALLRDHEFPLWNRYNSAGTPLLGQGQSCFGDPLHLIALLANGASWAWDSKFLLAKLLYALGIGFCVWRLCFHLPAAMLVAFSAQFIGFFVYRINHPAIFGLCYAPWILYVWMRIVGSSRLSKSILWMGALIAVNAVELSSGTVKEAYILLLALNFTGLCILLASDKTISGKFKLLAALILSGLVFAMVTAPAWYTFYRSLAVSRTSYDAAQAFQLQPGMFVGLFDEAFYRPFQIFTNVINPSANFFVLLGMIWLAVRWRSTPFSRTVAGILASTIPAGILIFGIVPPSLIAQVPFLGKILHVDNTFSCVLVVVFTVLAGVGWKLAWECLGSDQGRSESYKVMAVLVVIYMVYLGTAQAIVRTTYYEHTWGWLIKVGPFVHYYGLSLLAASGFLLWAMGRARARGQWSSEMVLLSILAFAALHWRHGLQIGMAAPDYVIMPTARVNLVAASPTITAIRAQQATPFRSIGFVDNFFPGWSAAYGLEGISGPDALMNRYYRELMEVSGIERVWDWRYKLEDKDLKSVRPMLDLLNVRFYLDYPAGQRADRSPLTPFLSADMEVYESRSSWPRAFFTDSAAVYSDLPQLWSWIRGGDGRPFAAIERSDWIKFDPLPSVSGALDTRKIQPAVDYHLTTDSTSFTVRATGPGLIVLSEAYEAGNFRAWLNGREIPYFRINHAFKGLYVSSAGDYRVTFSYWPKYFSLELVISAVGIVLVLLGMALAFCASSGGRGGREARIDRLLAPENG